MSAYCRSVLWIAVTFVLPMSGNSQSGNNSETVRLLALPGKLGGRRSVVETRS